MKNPALFLLALLKNANATMRLGVGGVLEIGPAVIAKTLAPKIREHKANLVRFLLDQDCPVCGLEMAPGSFEGGLGREKGEKLIWERFCFEKHYSTKRELPDFPVYDKTGKEI
jgi:hypothetical protein